MRYGIAGIFIFILALGFLSPARTVVAAEEVIRLGGSGIALASMKAVAEAFIKANPGAEVIVLPSIGSAGAIKAVSKKVIDIGISSRPLNNDEAGLGISPVRFGKTPFIVIANRSVKAGNISTKDIIRIFRGEMTVWSAGSLIRMIIRPARETNTLMLKAMSPEMSEAVDMAGTREGMIRADTDQENADIIEKTRGAVGFSALSLAVAERRNLKILRLDGRAPSLGNLKNGSYPHSFPLFTLTNKETSAGAQKFLNFMNSPAGKKILSKNGIMVIK
jgi:phosphate transport system substrate-binding protein